MNSGFLESPTKSPTKSVNKFTVKMDWPKSVMKSKSQDNFEKRRSGKENTGHCLVAPKKSQQVNKQKVKIGGPSERSDHDSINVRPLLDQQRLPNIQSHRYKPYETTRRRNSILDPITGVSRNLLYRDDSGLALPNKSSGLISVGPAVGHMPPPSMPSSQFLATGNVSLNSTMRLNPEAFKKTTSTSLQSSSFINQNNSYPLADGKSLYGVSTASIQVVGGSAGVSNETTQFRQLDSTKINVGSSKDDPVVGTQTLSQQQQNLNISTASCPGRSRRRASCVSKKRAQNQLLHHLNEVIDIQEILYSLSTDSQTRKDFLVGAKGAPQLARRDLEVIETIHKIITSFKRPTTVTEFILNQEASQQASEHFKLLMEGRDEVPRGANASYLEAKLIIQRVLRSGYFRVKRYNANSVKLEIKK